MTTAGAGGGAVAGRAGAPPGVDDSAVARVVKQVFGFDELRPLQRDAIGAALDGADALTVMPTGGGKSLCYQVPPLVTGRVTLVVSPLIALMRDQVSGLRLLGYPAAAAHSQLSDAERAELRESVAGGRLRLLFTSPERLLSEGFLGFIGRLRVGAIAVDEAHCISHWGHDFRPEYRRLAELREHFPGVPVQAFTATATPRVREDIVRQLRLENARVMVGRFDRPNLTYRVLPRVDEVRQTAEAVRRHPGGAAIVYCISRKETESLAEGLRGRGIEARAYHAGMEGLDRAEVSDDFRAERLNVVVATVAFGMGIDRSDVRLVVHVGMPKSVEGYQQETGRAGRDGLPAECLMLYSSSDVQRWRRVMGLSAGDAGGAGGAEESGGENRSQQARLLEEMRGFAAGARCRHAAISAYFGQEYGAAECGACDVCLRELEDVDDGHVVAQKVLSCVARCGQNVGAKHVASVLMGLTSQRVRERGHDRLSTFGLLAGVDSKTLGSYIDQLVDAGDLKREGDEFPVLRLTSGSAAVMKGERRARLVRPKAQVGQSERERRATHRDGAPLDGAERGLFEALRAVRKDEAARLGVPPYQVFSDATLEELCRLRPTSVEAMVGTRGIGAKKLEQFGALFAGAIGAYCRERGMAVEVVVAARGRGVRG
jgi:ATP-dependent DNA helicase RecQ